MESVPTESPFTDTEFPESLFPESPFDDTIDPCEEYKPWEGITLSTLQFGSKTSQICYVVINKNKITNNDGISLPKGTIAYEYKENLDPKDNEVILEVELDTINMFDTTNLYDEAALEKLKCGNIKDNVSLIRMVEQVTKNGGRARYKIAYMINDNGAVKNIKRIK